MQFECRFPAWRVTVTVRDIADRACRETDFGTYLGKRQTSLLKLSNPRRPSDHKSNLRYSVITCQRHPVTEFRYKGLMPIGDRVRQRRHQLGMSVADLSKATGIAPTTLYDLERGDQSSSTKLHRLAAALRCNVVWLDTGKGPPEISTQAELLAIAEAHVRDGWPFAVPRSRFERLPDRLKWKIEGFMESVILGWEQEHAGRKPAKKRRAG